MEGKEEEHVGGALQDVDEVLNLSLAYVVSMALKCAIELKIPDIIHSHGSPMSVNQIATKIGSMSTNVAQLSRVMRLLVHKSVFIATTITSCDQREETLYGLTRISRLLLHDSDMTMVPSIMMSNHPHMMASWHQLSASIRDGEVAVEKTYGSSFWEVISADPDLNSGFNKAGENFTKFASKEILTSYKDGFLGIETLVDVGGGTGYLLSAIVKDYSPSITGINFELKHVVESAPAYPGVKHVVGDMFKSIPDADGIIMKGVLHNWGDENCKKILRNCRSALSKKVRKIVLVEAVEEGEESFDETSMKRDLLMMVNFVEGKERTRMEWINLLEDTGFSGIQFIKISSKTFVIEAYAT